MFCGFSHCYVEIAGQYQPLNNQDFSYHFYDDDDDDDDDPANGHSILGHRMDAIYIINDYYILQYI